MAITEADERFVKLGRLTSGHGPFTMNLLRSLSSVQVRSAREASANLLDSYPYFFERLRDYVADRAGVNSDVKSAKAVLSQASDEKHLGISSRIMSEWLNPDKKREYTIEAENIFKLCLALELDVVESAQFVYSCLHQNWFNYRKAEEYVYCYYLAMQHIYGNETYTRALESASQAKAIVEDAMNETPVDQEAPSDATGYTLLIEQRLISAVDLGTEDADTGSAALLGDIAANKALFTGVKRSAIRQYNTFFENGGIGIKPLRTLYHEREGRVLPKASYLDPRDTRTEGSYEKNPDKQRKRLLWGADHRDAWLEWGFPDDDILHTKEIKIERHAVAKMQSTGILRGNMVALLFFHFCYEHAEAFKTEGTRGNLFERFYNTTNQILDDCGMMPLHPRKMLDSLFLKSVAHSGKKEPIQFFNESLSRFYIDGANN